MPVSKFYAMREMVYDKCLRSGREFTREQLMSAVNKELESRDMRPIETRVTFTKDMEELEAKLYNMYGHKVLMKEKRGTKLYYSYTETSESIYDHTQTYEEQVRLQQVSQLLQGFRGMPRFDWVDEVSARFDQGRRKVRHEIASFEGGTQRDEHFFLPLFNAISERHAVWLCYKKFGAEPTKRVVHPYYLKQYRQRWYLYGYDERRQDVLCFSLDRIESMSIADDVKYLKSDIDFTHYLDDVIGVTKPKDGVVEHVRLWVDRWEMNYLQTSPLHRSQQMEQEVEDGFVVSLDVIVNHELEQELLFLGEHVSVLSPEHFRQRITERIEQQLARQQKH